jgi:hypothetical protein
LQPTEESAGESHADQKREQPPGRNAEQEPAPGTPPQPCTKAMAAFLRRIHVESFNGAARSTMEKNSTRFRERTSVRYRTDGINAGA